MVVLRVFVVLFTLYIFLGWAVNIAKGLHASRYFFGTLGRKLIHGAVFILQFFVVIFFASIGEFWVVVRGGLGIILFITILFSDKLS